MTKEELRDYCYSIGLIDTELPSILESLYTNGYRYDGEFVNKMDFIAAWDENKHKVVVVNKCVIDEDFVNQGLIRMDGSSPVKSDEELKARIDELIKSVQENIRFLKWKQTKKRITKMEGDFE